MTTTIDHSAELARAGAHVSTRRQAMAFLARRYPLGAAGAVIIIIFTLTALFADWISPY